MHIGIIMDGNGRWATARGLPRLSGHGAGVAALKEIIRGCPPLHVNTVTLFAFAIANWKRDKEEVDGLWEIFYIFLSQDIRELLSEGVRVVVIGDKSGLPPRVREAIDTVETDSLKNTVLLLQIALNYDGVDEVARLIKNIIKEKVPPAEVTAQYVREHLDTQAGDEPDIVIRTGMPLPHNGMSVWRSSAFLPIQSAQSVCVSTAVLWPDFTLDHLEEVISFADPESRLFGAQRTKLETSPATV